MNTRTHRNETPFLTFGKLIKAIGIGLACLACPVLVVMFVMDQE